MKKLKQFWKWFLFQFFKLKVLGDGREEQSIYGKYRVKYLDGRLSKKMDYFTAKDYSTIFGGEVVWAEEMQRN